MNMMPLSLLVVSCKIIDANDVMYECDQSTMQLI